MSEEEDIAAIAAEINQSIRDAIEGGQTFSAAYVLPNGDIIGVGCLAGPSVNLNRVPSKAAGRKGTRRAWKRAHPPGWFLKGFTR